MALHILPTAPYMWLVCTCSSSKPIAKLVGRTSGERRHRSWVFLDFILLFYYLQTCMKSFRFRAKYTCTPVCTHKSKEVRINDGRTDDFWIIDRIFYSGVLKYYKIMNTILYFPGYLTHQKNYTGSVHMYTVHACILHVYTWMNMYHAVYYHYTTV